MYFCIFSVNGCDVKDSMAIIVNTTPKDPTVASNSPVCEGQDISLTASSATSGVSYSWTGPNSYTSSAQNPTITNSTTSKNGTYYCKAILGSCQSKDSSTSVTVNPIPTPPQISSNSPLCLGKTLKLTAKTITNATYKWSGPTFSSSNQNDSIPNVLATHTGSYKCRITINGCESSDSTINVVTTIKPTAFVTINGSVPFCPGDSVMLNATKGDAYLWTPGGETTPYIYAKTQGYYFCKVTKPNGCLGTADGDTSVKVYPKPAIPTITLSGDTLTSSTAFLYQWYIGSNPLSGETNKIFKVLQNGTYKVKTTDMNGCTEFSNSIIVIVGLGISESNSQNYIKVFPNPTSNSFTIQYSSQRKEELTIYNILGEQVYKDNWLLGQMQKSIDVSTFSKGMYIIKLGGAVQKIIKE